MHILFKAFQEREFRHLNIQIQVTLSTALSRGPILHNYYHQYDPFMTKAIYAGNRVVVVIWGRNSARVPAESTLLGSHTHPAVGMKAAALVNYTTYDLISGWAFGAGLFNSDRSGDIPLYAESTAHTVPHRMQSHSPLNEWRRPTLCNEWGGCWCTYVHTPAQCRWRHLRRWGVPWGCACVRSCVCIVAAAATAGVVIVKRAAWGTWATLFGSN